MFATCFGLWECAGATVSGRSWAKLVGRYRVSFRVIAVAKITKFVEQRARKLVIVALSRLFEFKLVCINPLFHFANFHRIVLQYTKVVKPRV